MQDHKCDKEPVFDQMKTNNEKLYKVIYGNGQPGLLTLITELSVNVKGLTDVVPALKEDIKSLMDFKAGEVAINNNKWKNIPVFISAIAIIVSIWAVSRNDTPKQIVITDSPTLRQAMREEKDITVRGPSITKENAQFLEQEIQSINK